MRALVQDRYGSPQVLPIVRVPDPAPAAGQLFVRVHAASVNARDGRVMRAVLRPGGRVVLSPAVGFPTNEESSVHWVYSCAQSWSTP